MDIDDSILENNEITFCSCFTFIPKQGWDYLKQELFFYCDQKQVWDHLNQGLVFTVPPLSLYLLTESAFC